MDDVFETVDRGDLAFAAFVRATHNENFIVFSDGNGADLTTAVLEEQRAIENDAITYVVLLTEFLAQRSAHDSSSDAGRRAIVGLARLSSRGVEG